jgi:hypothetical protein
VLANPHAWEAAEAGNTAWLLGGSAAERLRRESQGMARTGKGPHRGEAKWAMCPKLPEALAPSPPTGRPSTAGSLSIN